ncbi:MAG TPA: BON domain-containing protein [Acidocella sp.]|jgi:osmotically-inducible protein OsmY|nr:BON domain-containing protein [Acidocella sp.]
MSTNTMLQSDVIAELKWKPLVDAAQIGVTADDGVVTLFGHVSSLRQKEAALAAARQVKGVRVLVDEIEVRLPDAQKRHDDEIGKRVADIISWFRPQLAPRIKISVSHGVVTLEGEVEHFFEKMEAEQHISLLNGVTRIDNKLVVTPGVSPVDVKNKIEAAFQRNASLEARHVTVAVDGPKVTLTGQVRSWHDLEQAEEVAWAAPGVREVENLLEVQI